MKKLALVAAGLAAAGFFLMLVGFMMGITPLYVDSTGMHRRVLQEEKEDFTTNYHKSADVTLTFVSNDVTIVQGGDRFGYRISGRYYRPMETSLSARSLVIKDVYSASWMDFGWDGMVLFGQSQSAFPSVTIYIPEEMTIGTLDLNLASGDIKITSVVAEQAFIDGVSGDFSATNMIVLRGMKVNMVSGDMFVSGDLQGDLSFRTVSGDLKIEIDAPSDLYTWSVTGITADVNVSDRYGVLPSNWNRTPDLSGSSEIERPRNSNGLPVTPDAPDAPEAPDAPAAPGTSSDEKHEDISYRGQNRITVDVVSGDVSIRFLQ